MTDQTPFPMPMRPLGAGGPLVSLYALGAMTFGAETDQAEAFAMLDLFTARGGTVIDTADVYAGGVSEQIIGHWGRARGGLSDLFIATKCRFGDTAAGKGASRAVVLRGAEASLNRLQTDRIDLYFIHGWDKDVDPVETLGALGELRGSGLIGHVGWSNVTGWQLERICGAARAHGLPVPIALQPQYSLLERGIEAELLPCALENGLGVMPWSPLGGGWLTGKYRADARPSGATRLGEDPARGVEAYDIRNTDRTHAILRAAETIARAHDRPVAHVALAWLASRPGIASILLGARNSAQLAGNLDALDLSLTGADLAMLTRASGLPLPAYPQGFVRDWSGVDHWDRLGYQRMTGAE